MSDGRRRPARGLSRRWGVVLLIALTWPLLAWGLARALVTPLPLDRADALVVLSGSGVYVERTALGALRYREGRVPLVLVTNDTQPSGWSREEQRNPPFVDRAIAALRGGGVPAGRIEIVPGTITGTYDELAAVRRYAEQRGLGALLVVTSAYHTRRVRWTLARVFAGSGIALGLDPAPPSPPPGTWWLSARGWTTVGSEYVKLAYYRLRHG